MEFVQLTNYTRILQFCFCSYRYHGVVLTMFALNIQELSFDHHQTTEVTGQQWWWWWTFTTITASGVYQMQAVDGGCRWNAGGGNECSRNKRFISKDRYINYTNTYRDQRSSVSSTPKSSDMSPNETMRIIDHLSQAVRNILLEISDIFWNLLPVLENILLDIILVHPRLNIQHTSSSTQEQSPHYPSRIFSSIFTKNILLNTHQEYPRLSLLLLQPLPRGSQECPLQNQCLPACPRRCSPL